MTKKLHDEEQMHDTQLREAVRTSAQQIWQAGLGAFAIAREEGSDFFARLMKEGVGLQTRTQQLAGQKISDVISKMTETIGKQTAGPLGKMEEVFEERVTRTLRNFGVPTQDDLKALTEEIEDLRKTVTALSNIGAKTKKAAGVSNVKAKAAAKPGARKVTTASVTAATRSRTALKKPAKAAAENRA